MVKNRIKRLTKKYNKEDKRLAASIKMIVGSKPFNIKPYQIATQHTSVAKSIKKGFKESNERLEYLGDAVLGMAVADYLFKKYPYKDEGFLTELRSRIVSRESLNQVAITIGIPQIVQFDRKRKTVNSHKSLYGNTLEALIGAIFLDSDFLKAKEITLSILDIDFSKLLLEEQKDSKTLLQEFLQSLDEDLPEYATTEKKQNGEIYFVSKVTLPKHNVFGEGQGKSKKLAEQEAASNVLIMLNKDGK